MKLVIAWILFCILLVGIDMSETAKFDSLPENEKIALIQVEKAEAQAQLALEKVKTDRQLELIVMDFSSVDSGEKFDWIVAYSEQKFFKGVLSILFALIWFPLVLIAGRSAFGN